MRSPFFNFQTKTITFSALILGISYLVSSLLGLLRDRLLTSTFGASWELDVYFAAFRIPDFVYNILILGGLTVAFLPLFAEYFSQDRKEAWRMVNYLLNAFLFFLILLSLLLFIFTPWLIKWLFPGFGPEHQKLAIPLTRLLFLSPIIFGISNIFSGILQYFNRFFIYGLAPVFYNLGIILGILFLTPKLGIFGAAIGVILGAFLHLTIQIFPAKNCGFFYQPLFNFQYPAIKRIFKLMVPRVFGVAAQQINLIVITVLASTITAGSITIFNLSNNLQSLPTGLIGASFAIAVFPVLSRAWVQNQKKEFLESFSLIFRQILFFIIPISLLIFFLRNQIVLYKTGKFTLSDAQLTAACLGIFTFSIFAQSLILLLARAFFSLQDTKTPTKIALLAVTLNIILSFSLIWLLKFESNFNNFFIKIFSLSKNQEIGVLGLVLAFSFSAIFQFLLLYFAFWQKIKKLISYPSNPALSLKGRDKDGGG